MNTPDTPPVTGTPEDRTVAILSYLTIIGFIIALIIHNGRKTKLGAYHLRQMLGLILASLVGGVLGVVPLLGWLAMFVVWIGLLVLWVMGLMSAINAQTKPVPLLGEMFQKWFLNAFE